VSTRILVAYASKCGSTSHVASAIAHALADDGVTVDVVPIVDAPEVSGYDAVIVGSAIREGAWLPEAVSFVKANKEELEKVPTAFFTVSMTMREDTPENRATVAGYVAPVREILRPVSEGMFAGALDYAKLPPAMRDLLKARRMPEGDFRDWNAIRDWAESLRPNLLAAA
jgi:menaquinone-dependent protoporphyrinogen oxidase